MPKNTSLTRKNRPFNLIERKVELKETVKTEKDWYILFNILFVCLIIVLSGVSFLYKSYMQSGLRNAKQVLASKINSKLNTNSKELAKAEISVLNDKFAIYEDFLDQNFDVNEFYGEVQEIYPGLKISKFSAEPNSPTIEINVRFDSNGYSEFPRFVSALEASKKFGKSIIKGVNFSMKDTSIQNQGKSLVDQKDNTDGYITEVSISIVRHSEASENAEPQS